MASTNTELQAEHSPQGIMSLPTEMLFEIAKHLNVQDHSRLSRTCHHMAWALQYRLFKRHSFLRPRSTNPTIVGSYSHMEYVCEGRRYCHIHNKFKCFGCEPAYVSEAIIVATINRCLAFGLPASVNSTINYFDTPLLVAVEYGNLHAVNYLISLHADVNYNRPIGAAAPTALGTAIRNMRGNMWGNRSVHVDITLALLRAGATPSPSSGYDEFGSDNLYDVFRLVVLEVAEGRLQEDKARALFDRFFQPMVGFDKADFDIYLWEERLEKKRALRNGTDQYL